MDISNKSKNNNRAVPRQQGLLLTAVSTAALLSVAPIGAAHADVVANGPDMLFTDLAPVSDAELDQNRGGFSIGNISLWVGMTVTTTVEGASPGPIAVTTNFTVVPGQLTNLGSQISGDVNSQVAETLAGAGIGNGSNSSGKNSSPQQQVADNSTPGQQGLVGDNSALGTGDQNAKTNVQVTPNQSQQSNAAVQSPPPPPPPQPTGDAKITDNGPPPATFTAQVDPQTKSINLTNNAGTNVNVTAADGLITRITNNLSGVSVKTQVDLNYVVNNYREVVANGQNFQQAMNLAQQLLAIHGIAGN